MKAKALFSCLAMAIIFVACADGNKYSSDDFSLKEKFGDKFLMGVALNTRQVTGEDSIGQAVARKHFNCVVAEDGMKCENIHPEKDRYYFESSDSLVAFAEANGMKVIGHCLIWHSQCAPWFFLNDDGSQVSADELKKRMKEHISTIVGRYKGRVFGWDVVNETVIEDGSYRKSKFYEILGEDYIPLAFEYAHEADPDAELYINDYGMNVPGRRNTIVKIVHSLKEKGLRIDGVGMQGHMGMDYPELKDFEDSMLAFAAEGVKVMISEWEMSALPTISATANITDTVAFSKELTPYPESLPDSVSQVWNARMKAFFELFLKHSDIVSRVTVWGVSDGDSWKNDFPMKGRHDYPLLFDRNYEMKPFMKELCGLEDEK